MKQRSADSPSVWLPREPATQPDGQVLREQASPPYGHRSGRAQATSTHDQPEEDWGERRVVSPPPPYAAPRRAGRRLTCGLALALLAMALVIAGAAAFLLGELWLRNRVLPGVQVWDVDVGGLTREQVMQRLQSSFHYPADRTLVLRYGPQTWPVTPDDLGLQLDLDSTADAALALGHGDGLVSRIKEQVDVLFRGRLVVPAFSFDPRREAMFLGAVASQVDQPLRSASLRLGDGLSVEVIPGQAGLEVDQEATLQALRKRFAELSGGEVELVVRVGEPLLTDLSAAQTQVQRILGGPVTLTAPGFDAWTIEPKTLAEWLILKPTTGADGRPTLSVSLDADQVSALADTIAAQVQRPPIEARFRWDDATGGVVPTVASVPGQTLDITATVVLVENAASSDQRAVALPLIAVPPALASEDASRLGITELLAEGTTRFAGSSEAREQNIAVGAAQFDGLLIAPGETFSFNHYLGEVTAEKGYVEGIIIWGDTTRADVGGGLCQVASTAFRAAFWAGVPIVERTPHAFRVSYYEPPVGLDATIYSPSVDLKWANDTGHYLLIQTNTDRESKTLTFRFYGTNPGRTVELDGPDESNPIPHGPPVYRDDPTLPKGETKQIEWPKDGLDVTLYRVIKENGVEVRRDTFFSRYRPWQAVYLVGTKE